MPGQVSALKVILFVAADFIFKEGVNSALKITLDPGIRFCVTRRWKDVIPLLNGDTPPLGRGVGTSLGWF